VKLLSLLRSTLPGVARSAVAALAATPLVLALCAAGSAVTQAAEAPAQNPTISGEVVVEPTTLIAAGFRWIIDGDANSNASVQLQYRRSGSSGWQQGLPLLRLHGEQMNNVVGAFTHVVANQFAGSLFDLEPATDYEVQLTLSDPDGVHGATQYNTRITTRAEPQVPEGGRVFHVYPPGYEGEKLEPAFSGLLAAYYERSNGADWFNAYPPRVQPGDVILVHAGLYKAERMRYVDAFGVLFDGTYHFRQSGTAEKPIVIKGAGDGEAIFDGGGNHILFEVMGASHLHFEGLTLRNTEVAIQAGYKGLVGSEGLIVKNTRFEDVGRGIYTDWSGSRNFYIADNVFIGRSHPDRLEGWIGRVWQGTPGFPTSVISEVAVKVYGSGHVIAHNFVRNFHDGIDHATYGAPDGNPDPIRERMPVSIDIYNNDITNVDDNCIEADGAMHNIRILRNRCFNQGHRSLSAQPVFGGPVYFIRNVVYHAPEGGSLKLTADSAGVVVYHNTFTSEVLAMGGVSNQHYRNNLVLGQGAAEPIMAVQTFTSWSSSDYNGFRLNPGAANHFAWTAPADGVAAIYDATALVARQSASLDTHRAATGQEQHSVLVDYDVFVNVPQLDTSEPWVLHDPAMVDFQLRAGSVAVDAGIALPGINDGFTGAAPDLGALELGQPVPHYGPRP
jgi:hypothetical protein